MLNIITLGDAQLRKHSIVVPDLNGAVHTLIEQMLETLREYKGIGLAAVQVGNLYRLFVSEVVGDRPRVFVNPEILETSLEQVSYEEGCLSIPGVEADVLRPQRVRVQAWNEKGRPFTLDAEDLLSRVIQHEYDHLNGVLFIDRIDPKKRERLVRQFNTAAPL